jgi:hypothetical protein
VIDYLSCAIELAGSGFKVFPVWGARADGTCACGHPHDGTPAYPGAKHNLGTKDVGKHPASPRGHVDATSDEASLRDLWSSGMAVAIACEASALVVIDVDPRNGGVESFKKLEAICPLPATAAVKTGGGGAHFYYRHPGGKFPPNLAKLGYPGVDIKTRGYVVAPPSLHASGKRYEWACRTTPVDLPGQFVSLARSSAVEGETVDYDGGQPASEALLADAWQRLERHGPSVQGKGGDAHAYQVGTILLCDYDLQWDDAVALAKRWNAHFPENHWNEDKLLTKLRNAASYATGARGIARVDLDTEEWFDEFPFTSGALAPGTVASDLIDHGSDSNPSSDDNNPSSDPGDHGSDPDFLQLVLQAARDIKAYRSGAGAQSDKPTPIFSPAVNLLHKEFPKTSWLVQGLITTESVAVISGEPKSTKSWCAQEVCLAIATNTPAFEKFSTGPPLTAALFLPEDAERNTRNRLRSMAIGRGLNPSDALQNIHLSCRQPINLTDDVQLALMIASCRILPSKPSLLVMDPMRDLHGGDEDSSKEMGDFMGRLRALRDILGVCVLFVHHSAKTNADVSKRRSGQKMRGSGAIHGAVDCGFYVSNVDGDRRCNWTCDIEVEIKAAQGAGVFKLDLHVVDDEHGEAESTTWSVRSIGESDPEKAAFDKDVQVVADFLLGQPDYQATVQAIAQSTLSYRRVSRAIETMHSQGWIHKALYGAKHIGWKLDEAIVAQRKAEALLKERK